MNNLSLLSLILDASIVVQIVMLILLIFSIVSWAVIFSKFTQFSAAKNMLKTFSKTFAQGNGFNLLVANVNKIKDRDGVVQVFFDGVTEFNRSIKSGVNDKAIITQNIERTLSKSINAEMAKYSRKLDLLATFGSVSPYIGLFGTVWGIMHSFMGLSSSNQATLASVAPGIAEALVATAVGLFVAIPAYIFYNKYNAGLANIESELYNFADEFLNVINRKIYGDKDLNEMANKND